jgi:ribulose-5-phosphate 4-epimerase/fuculose-1-phosphate aldolase
VAQILQSGRQKYAAFYMKGNGGNKVVAIPELKMTVVITSRNFGTREMREQTDKIVAN